MDPETANNQQPIAPELVAVPTATFSNQPTTTPVPQVPPSSKSKLPLIFGIVVLLGIVGVVGVLLGKNLTDSKTPATVQPIVTVTTSTPTPTADPTANWKTYTKMSDNFSIKHPLDWKTREEEYYPGSIKAGEGSELIIQDSDSKFNSWISIQALKGSLQDGKKTLEGWAKESGGTLESFNLDGVSGYRLNWINKDPISSATRIDLRLEKNGLLYLIGLSVNDKSSKRDLNIETGKKILSTFKFLE